MNEINFCLNSYDDGIVWNLKTINNNLKLTHINTFHALSYISETKKDTVFRFVDNINQKYIIIVDCNGHVFVYENPNLQTNDNIKPFQFSFNIQDRPLGITMINDSAVILTKNNLFILSL